MRRTRGQRPLRLSRWHVTSLACLEPGLPWHLRQPNDLSIMR